MNVCVIHVSVYMIVVILGTPQRETRRDQKSQWVSIYVCWSLLTCVVGLF
jgi:hypothetical protein